MTALELTYEDGLRLSELIGSLSRLEFEQDHLWMCNLAALLFIAIMVAVFWILINKAYLVPAEVCASDEGVESSGRTLFFRLAEGETFMGRRFMRWVPTTAYWIMFVAGLILLPIVAVAVAYACMDFGLQAEMADIRGQIDAIEAKYGGGL